MSGHPRHRQSQWRLVLPEHSECVARIHGGGPALIEGLSRVVSGAGRRVGRKVPVEVSVTGDEDTVEAAKPKAIPIVLF